MDVPMANRVAPCVVCGYDRSGLARRAACPECGNAPQNILPTHMCRWEKVGLAGVILIALPPGPVLGLIAMIGAAVAWGRLAPDTPRVYRQSVVLTMVIGAIPVFLWLAFGTLVLAVNIGLV